MNIGTIEEYWEYQKNILNEIYSKGTKQYIENLTGLPKAFQKNNKILRCIDEGVLVEHGGVHSAGSCILCGEKKAKEFLKKSGAKGITSHEGCGAAKLDAINKGIDPAKADEHGMQWAKHLAKISGIPYVGHIEAKQMGRPANFHIARVAYYDATGKFNPSAIKELPIGFVISRKYMNADQAIIEAGISASIATGHHGFGAKIDQKNPFVIIAVADPNNRNLSLENLKTELKSVKEEYKGKVIIDGFTAQL